MTQGLLNKTAPLCGRVFYQYVTRDGKRIRIRGMCPEDKDRLIEFYEKLSLETIYTRFFSIIKYFEPYVEKLVKSSGCVIVAEDLDTGEIVGVAEAIPEGDKAEAGIVVLEGYQGKGIGKMMAKAMNRALYERGIKVVVGYIMLGNVKALRLVKSLGGRPVKYYESMILVEIPIRQPEND